MAKVIVAAESGEALADALNRLRGNGTRLVEEERAEYTYTGRLSEDAPAMPFLAALLRALVSEDEHALALVAARVWLSCHCTYCGGKVPTERMAHQKQTWCEACAAARASGELERIDVTEEMIVPRDIALAMLKSPDLSDEERTQFYLLSMGAELSQIARRGARLHGRGVVIVDDRDQEQFKAYYVAEKTVREQGKPWPSDQVAEWVRDYDPAATMVVMFVRESSTQTYRMTLAPDAMPSLSPLASAKTVAAA